MLDVREDFPFLERRVNGKNIAYLDNAATTQKPRVVLERIAETYLSGISNVHRAVNFLANEVTEAFEGARGIAAQFIGAQSREIVFTANATQGINLVVGSLASQKKLRVLTSTLEHHSNLLPWTQLCQPEFVPWTSEMPIDMEAFEKALAGKPDLVALGSASNFLGGVRPMVAIGQMCRKAGVPLLLDASQSIAHYRHDVRQIGCDYMVFSGHKIYGPGGTGILYMSDAVIDQVRPAWLGGGMVKEVHAETYVPNDVPYRFEAGTPNIEGVIGLGAAFEYIASIGFGEIAAHESDLADYARRRMAAVRGLTLLGPTVGETVPVVAFHLKGVDSALLAKVLAERDAVIVRAGFHCAQPAHDQLSVSPSVRASFAVYNTREEIDRMVTVIELMARTLQH